jgi:hypothetical protein
MDWNFAKIRTQCYSTDKYSQYAYNIDPKSLGH